MPSDFVQKQLEKLLEGKTLIILSNHDFEQLVLAAVPALRLEADELEAEGKFVQAQQLTRLARELDNAPTTSQPPIINLSASIH